MFFFYFSGSHSKVTTSFRSSSLILLDIYKKQGVFM